MQSNLTDAELRETLLKYMDDVPPVTVFRSPKTSSPIMDDMVVEEISLGQRSPSPKKSRSRNVQPSASSFMSQSSPIMECAARLPCYSRRSIHPENPDLASPYSEYHLRDYQLTSPTRVGELRPRGRQQSRSVDLKKSTWSAAMPTGLVSTLISCFNRTVHFAGSTLGNRLSLRLVSFILLLIGIIFVTSKVLLGDPFYHNPVNELRGMWQPRRT